MGRSSRIGARRDVAFREQITAQQVLWRMVELGGVSRAGFYRFDPDRRPQPDGDMDLRDAIQRIASGWPCYSQPKITAELRRRGWKVNPKRVYRLMREDNLL